MYDELVKRLKEDKSWVEQGTTQTEHEIAEHIQQAADAIEELTGLVQEAERDRDEYKERLDKANDTIEELQKRVPKTPHGRLIDADALMHEFEKAQRTMEQHGQEYSCSFMSSSQEISTEWYCVDDMLENAPTIIPAEEGET